jgi:uncharacterized protein YndB with AHSA1/START domain
MPGTNGQRRLAGIGDDAVKAKTGKTWQEWVTALDKAGARDMRHSDLAAMVQTRFGVADWWSQMVTVGYEQAIGKRQPRQKADGFAASASRTVDQPAAALFRAFHNARSRARWLDHDLTIRKATAPKSLRITWGDGKTHVDVNIYPKGAAKSQVSLQHTRLASSREAERMKKYWGEALDRLKEELE